MGQRLARVQTQVAAVCRTLDGETKKLADLQRLIGVKQQVGDLLAACCLPVDNTLRPANGIASLQPMQQCYQDAKVSLTQESECHRCQALSGWKSWIGSWTELWSEAIWV